MKGASAHVTSSVTALRCNCMPSEPASQSMCACASWRFPVVSLAPILTISRHPILSRYSERELVLRDTPLSDPSCRGSNRLDDSQAAGSWPFRWLPEGSLYGCVVVWGCRFSSDVEGKDKHEQEDKGATKMPTDPDPQHGPGLGWHRPLSELWAGAGGLLSPQSHSRGSTRVLPGVLEG